MVERLAGAPRGRGVERQQLGVVVEHLLEVGDAPVAVDAVAAEAAADLVAHPAERHAPQCEERHRLAVLLPTGTEQEPQQRRLRELGRVAEAAAFGVVGVGEFLARCGHDLRAGRRVVRRRPLLDAPEHLGQRRALLADGVALLAEHVLGLAQQLGEGG